MAVFFAKRMSTYHHDSYDYHGFSILFVIMKNLEQHLVLLPAAYP